MLKFNLSYDGEDTFVKNTRQKSHYHFVLHQYCASWKVSVSLIIWVVMWSTCLDQITNYKNNRNFHKKYSWKFKLWINDGFIEFSSSNFITQYSIQWKGFYDPWWYLAHVQITILLSCDRFMIKLKVMLKLRIVTGVVIHWMNKSNLKKILHLSCNDNVKMNQLNRDGHR